MVVVVLAVSLGDKDDLLCYSFPVVACLMLGGLQTD
jgi:hypothetical protein